MKHEPDFPPLAPAHVQELAAAAPRDRNGRFGGQGAVPLDVPAPPTRFVAVEEVDEMIVDVVAASLADAAAHDPNKGPAPVTVLAASPGTGKSTAARRLLAGPARAMLSRDVLYLAPTLILAAEAGEDARSLGSDAHVFSGRAAAAPPGEATVEDERMCRKWEIAERVAKLDQSVSTSLCRQEEGEKELLCEHYSACAYRKQILALPAGPVDRYASSPYLFLPDPTQRAVSLVISDESFWRKSQRTDRIPVDVFVEHRGQKGRRLRSKLKVVEAIADLMQAARGVTDVLMREGSLLDLPYREQDYRQFARWERDLVEASLGLHPGMSAEAQHDAVSAAEAAATQYAAVARLWDALAEAVRQGRSQSERVQYVIGKGKEEGRRMILLHRRTDLSVKAPMLLLDADAHPEILEAFFPVQRFESVALRPNAEVIQLHDRRMGASTIRKARSTREDLVAIIKREVLLDRARGGGGVLVGCTRKVALSFFEDAGYSFGSMKDAQVSMEMLGTPLHGGQWLWFGDRALGSNAYAGCTTVVVIGRAEMPLDALEAQGRALFGDREGENLRFVEPDEDGELSLPLEMTPYEMVSGEAVGVLVPVHPDPKISVLHRHGREGTSRQLVERLRLGRSPTQKRVVLCCNIPLQGLPVDRLVAWDELVPSRLERALVEAFGQGGFLLLSDDGLSRDAPSVFRSRNAAATWRSRMRSTLRAGTFSSCTGMQDLPAALVRLRPAQPRTRACDCIVLLERLEGLREHLEARCGPLAKFDVVAGPAPLNAIVAAARF